MSALGISSGQEMVIGIGLLAVAGAVAYYEYEKSKEPPGQTGGGICAQVGRVSVPWWEEVGAVVVTGGLALGPVAAYEACRWYDAPPGITTLQGTQKVGIFQGTWPERMNKDGSVEFICDSPVILYGNYTFDQIVDLKKQYRGKENYLIFKPSDVQVWVDACKATNAGAAAANKTFDDYKHRVGVVEDALQKEYSAAAASNLPYPFTDVYIRSKCSAAGLDSASADLIITGWHAIEAGYDSSYQIHNRDAIYTRFTKAVDQAKQTATGNGVLWPQVDAPPNMPKSMTDQLQSDETMYLAGAKAEVLARYPYHANQDDWQTTLVVGWQKTVDAAKPTKNWPTMPSYLDIMNQGLDPQHAYTAYGLCSAYLESAKLSTK